MSRSELAIAGMAVVWGAFLTVCAVFLADEGYVDGLYLLAMLLSLGALFAAARGLRGLATLLLVLGIVCADVGAPGLNLIAAGVLAGAWLLPGRKELRVTAGSSVDGDD